jgi:TPR repeat protein
MTKASESGYGLAQSQLGAMLLEGKGIQKNQAEALEWIEKSMAAMTPNDCYNNGMAFYSGITVVKDYALSFRFMEMAAEKDHVLAQAHLALVYHQGSGVEKKTRMKQRNGSQSP